MAIDNKSLIIPLLEFPHKEIFYFCQVLQRGKDNPHLKVSNSRVIKTYYITSVEKLEENYEEMKKLAEVFNARVYINLNPRNFEKAAFKVLQKIADQMMNKDFYNVRKAYDSICGEYHSEIDKRWLLDIDSFDLMLVDNIQGLIEEIQRKVEKQKNNKVLARIPTKNGYHLITNPFNIEEFKKYANIFELHKNNPTVLYCL